MSQSDVFLSKKLDGSLDAFITSTREQPDPVAISPEIRDRGSLFVANIYRATTPAEAQSRVNHLRNIVHRAKKATHEISAWRCMVLKAGRTGLQGPDDFELKQGSKDDGESWAGAKILKVMERCAVIDAVVIVSRWYGGTLLGPARFSHIEICAEEVCKAFKKSEELQDCITTLRTLDDLLSMQRQKFFELSMSATNKAKEAHLPHNPSHAKEPNYQNLDVTKARRLIQARENAINSVKSSIVKKNLELNRE